MRKSYKANDKDYLDYVDNLVSKKPKKSKYKAKSNQTLKNKNNNIYKSCSDEATYRNLMKYEFYL